MNFGRRREVARLEYELDQAHQKLTRLLQEYDAVREHMTHLLLTHPHLIPAPPELPRDGLVSGMNFGE